MLEHSKHSYPVSCLLSLERLLRSLAKRLGLTQSPNANNEAAVPGTMVLYCPPPSCPNIVCVAQKLPHHPAVAAATVGRVGCRATGWCQSGSLTPHKDRTSKHPTVLTRGQTMHEPLGEMQHEQTVANRVWPHLPLGDPTAPQQSEHCRAGAGMEKRGHCQHAATSTQLETSM